MRQPIIFYMYTGDDLVIANVRNREIRKIRKILLALFILFTAAVYSVCSGYTAFAQAESSIVIEKESGRVLYQYDPRKQMAVASTTKIMTAIVAIEYGDPDDIVTVSANAANTEGSSMYLESGEEIGLNNLLYGLMLSSGNDAAVAISEHITEKTGLDFVGLMNEKARSLGAESTHFDNPNGLPSDTHYSTAYDMAVITKYALDNPKFKEIVSTKSVSLPGQNGDYGRALTNHNKLLSMCEGCIGVKTGYTKSAGRCLVSAVERGGMTLICVTLNDPDDWNDHMYLYDQLFSEYGFKKIISKTDKLAEIKVENGTSEYIKLVSDKEYSLPLNENDKYAIETDVNPEYALPVSAGDVLGSGRIILNGEEYGRFNLIAENSVDEIPADTFSEKLKDNMSGILSFFMQLFTGQR